jgi:glucosyl-dolichyl phosphate glucuronosyltransferase
MDGQPFISIVIATRNRERLLAETLRSLGEQDWPAARFEIVVADNGSSDGTRHVVAQAAAASTGPRIRYLFVTSPGKSFAVNAALDLAMHESSDPAHIIALTDDDVRPGRDWLGSLARAFHETGADFVAGRVFPLWEVEPPAWMSPAMYGVLAIPDNGDERVLITPAETRVVPIGANMAVRAYVIRHVGGLRTDLGKLEGTLRTGEDHEFFVRMLAHGYRGVYEPTAVVRHWVPRERLDRAYCRKWLYQNGRDVARLDAHGPEVKRLLGVPRYLWRQAAHNVARMALTRHPAQRFAATTQVLWLAGYLRERWSATS